MHLPLFAAIIFDLCDIERFNSRLCKSNSKTQQNGFSLAWQVKYWCKFYLLCSLWPWGVKVKVIQLKWGLIGMLLLCGTWKNHAFTFILSYPWPLVTFKGQFWDNAFQKAWIGIYCMVFSLQLLHWHFKTISMQI
jgi:hypothetical protein